MNNKNYTMTCLWVGEIKDENLKEVAKVMMWNCCPATYKDDEIIANAGLHMALDDEPHRFTVFIDDIQYNYDLTSKRVSAKMGKEIVELILKAVGEYKEAKAKEAEDMKERYIGLDAWNCYIPTIVDTADRNHTIPVSGKDEIVTIGREQDNPTILVNPSINEIMDTLQDVKKECVRRAESVPDSCWTDEGEFEYTTYDVYVRHFCIKDKELVEKYSSKYEFIVNKEDVEWD